MISDLIQGTPRFRYNPFGGISDHELTSILLPKYDLTQIAQELKENPRSIIQFVGKKGRGKTSHLRMLQYELPDAALFLLDRNSSINEINQCTATILLIDSIHHIPVWQRHKLFKQHRAMLFTTHWSKQPEFLLARRPYKSYYFKGINTTQLQTIVERRITKAMSSNDPVILNTDYLQQLVKKHGDHYRGILNELYRQFQSAHYEQTKRNI